MATGVSQYPYMVMVFILCTVFCYCYFVAESHRKTLLVAGVLSVPGSFLTGIFVPEYWQPVRLFGWELGIEDVLFSFSTGALVWLLAVSRRGTKRLAHRFNWKVGVKRYFKMCAVGAVVFLPISMLEGLHLMPQILIVMVVTALLVGRHDRHLFNIGFLVAVQFGVLYTLLGAAAFKAFPYFSLQWQWENLWGITFLSFPLEEIAWAFVFGFTWSLIMFYILDTEPIERTIKEM